MAGRDRLGRLDDLLELADEVVGVLELAVLDVEGVAAEPRALGEEHAARLRCVDRRPRRRSCTSGCGCSARPTPGSPRRRGNRCTGRAASRAAAARCRGSRSRPRLERQRAVRAGLRPPQRDQLLQLLGCSAARSWHSLGSVSVSNSSHRCGAKSPHDSGAAGDSARGLPALVPDRARAEHRVELRLLPGVGASASSKAGREADALDRLLGVALDDLGQLDAEAFVAASGRCRSRGCTAGASRLRADPRRPGDDQRVGGAALVVGVALPQLERRVERPRPAGRIVVVRLAGRRARRGTGGSPRSCRAGR